MLVPSIVAAFLAGRVAGPGGPWLWNLDAPKIDYPLAAFFHQALSHGSLPLWNDNLGLGFPLYAEGQIGAFYPPNWLIYLLPPLQALDATRVLHLALAGTATGFLALRLSGSRAGAALASLAAILCGGIVAKLEWTNLVVAYAWLPAVLLPLVRRPAPTRAGLVAAGLAWGVQALAGHPNVWLLTGLTAAVTLLVLSPRPVTLARIAGFGLLGGCVGAAQLIPTALLTTLSVRSGGLSASDLFASAATVFDPLGFAFSNVFVRGGTGSTAGWDLATTWYPDGSFALLEASAYVGLPLLVLASVGARTRRGSRLLAVAAVLAAIPVIAAFRPPFWDSIPVLDSLRSPVRSYLVVDLLLALAAALGVERLAHGPATRLAGRRVAFVVVAVLLAAWVAAMGLAVAAPDAFASVLGAFSIFTSSREQARLAAAALTSPWPVLAEAALGIATLGLVLRGRRGPLTAGLAVVLAAVPLLALMPPVNPQAPESAFSSAGTPFVAALRQADPHRVATYGEPGWYEGMPDMLAAAGVPDVRMFSSLDLLADDQLADTLRAAPDDSALRRAVGIDVVVTFGKPCGGTELAAIDGLDARICRDPSAARPPYWLPAGAVEGAAAGSGQPGGSGQPAGSGGAWPVLRPAAAQVDLATAAAAQIPAQVESRDETSLVATVAAPADGYVWIDRSWWPGWLVTVDGRTAATASALGGTLVAVPAGTHTIGQRLLPWDAGLGALLGLVAAAIAGCWVWLGRRGVAAAEPGRPAAAA